MLESKWQKELKEQFQKKLEEFDAKFPTEESCVEAIYRKAQKKNLVKCHYCGSREYYREFGSRTNSCKDCKKETWFTSDTFFSQIRRIRAWFGVIWLREQGVFVSSNQIHIKFGVAPSTAALINKRLDRLLQEQFDHSAKSVHSSVFEKLILRRSIETPAFRHPNTQLLKQEKSLESKSSKKFDDQNQSDFSKEEKIVLEALSSEPQTFESLVNKLKVSPKDLAVTLSLLEISGDVKRLPGDNYVLTKQVGKSFNGIENLSIIAKDELKRILEFIRAVYRGISWRYLEMYLANYWCFASRQRFGPGTLLSLCLKSRPFENIELTDIRSKESVRIMPVAA